MQNYDKTATAKILWERPVADLSHATIEAIRATGGLTATDGGAVEAVELEIEVEAEVILMDDRRDDYLSILSVQCAMTGEAWTEREFERMQPELHREAIEKCWEAFADRAEDDLMPEGEWPAESPVKAALRASVAAGRQRELFTIKRAA